MSNAPTAPNSTLRGQVVFVTGAGRGLGRAISAELAARGARVVMMARSAPELESAASDIRSSGGRADTFVGDVTDQAAMRRIVSEVEKSIGPIQVLINNAGVVTPIEPLSDADHDDWWRDIEVNLRGPALCMRLVLPLMQLRRSGRIINVVSGAGISPFTYFSAYVASKTALVRLTESVAAEVKPYGVSVFAMEPGTVATAMSDYSVTSDRGRRWIPWFRRIFDEKLNATPERVARRAADLASGKADALSGRYIALGEDLDTLVANAQRIVDEQLYSLRIKRLDASAVNPKLAAIRRESETASANILQLRVTLPVSRDVAFSYWTDARAVEYWYLPETGAKWIRPPVTDAKPGGEFALEVATAMETFRHMARFRDVEAGRRLALDWSWETTSATLGAGSRTTVTVDFVDADGGTDVIVVHEGFTSEQARDAFIAGWARCLTRIKTYAVRR
ncbi:MAG TPA: SDR family NAD(P)-dependent oxidoreductase, partial [Gemmatimonadaceae bacterium]